MNIDAYKSTLDRITETITQADPDFVLDPALDPLSQIAQALPNVIGGGGSGGGDVVYIDTLLLEENLGGIAESYNSLKALYDAHKTVRFNFTFAESGDDEFVTYKNLCPILVLLEHGDVYRAVFVYATYDGVLEMVFKADAAEENMRLDD